MVTILYDDDQEVRVRMSKQEAALVSLLLGATPPCGPGQRLYDQLDRLFPADEDSKDAQGGLRTRAARAVPLINTINPNILAYLGQFPGD